MARRHDRPWRNVQMAGSIQIIEFMTTGLLDPSGIRRSAANLHRFTILHLSPRKQGAS